MRAGGSGLGPCTALLRQLGSAAASSVRLATRRFLLVLALPASLAFGQMDGTLRYGGDGNEPILLIVDTSSKIAYFELVHL